MLPFKGIRISSRLSPKPFVSIPLSKNIHCHRQFSSTPPHKAQNRIYNPVRNPHDLSTYISLSTSTSKPLLTLWSTSYCPTCAVLSPMLRSILENGTGETEGGVLFCEVEYDAPDIMNEGLGMRYMITSVPSLVGFFRGEVIASSEGVRGGGRLGAKEMQSLGREGLEEWVRRAARIGEEWRGRHGGGGGGLFGLFGR